MRSILVTGAGRGFGRELVKVYGERGWRLFPLLRDRGVAEELEGTYGKACHTILGDVGSEGIEREIAAVLERRTVSLDILINNAGNIKKLRGLERTTAEDLEELFRIHCVGAFRCTRAALPFLVKAERPVVVNVTSRWGSIARSAAGKGGGIYSYQIAKCSQNMLTACLDQELKEKGVRVFALHPGRLRTEVAAPDADTPPIVAALALADWIEKIDRDTVCGCHDLMGGGLVEW